MLTQHSSATLPLLEAADGHKHYEYENHEAEHRAENYVEKIAVACQTKDVLIFVSVYVFLVAISSCCI